MKKTSPRPSLVSIAVLLLVVTVVIGIIRMIMQLSQIQQFLVAFSVIISIFTFAILGFFIYMIWKGRNWARIVYLVLFLVGILYSILPLIRTFSTSLFSGILALIQMALEIIALILLFQKASSAWFKSMKTGKR